MSYCECILATFWLCLTEEKYCDLCCISNQYCQAGKSTNTFCVYCPEFLCLSKIEILKSKVLMPGIPWWKTTRQKYLTAIENQVLKILRRLSQGEFFKTLLIPSAIFFLVSHTNFSLQWMAFSLSNFYFNVYQQSLVDKLD